MKPTKALPLVLIAVVALILNACGKKDAPDANGVITQPSVVVGPYPIPNPVNTADGNYNIANVPGSNWSLLYFTSRTPVTAAMAVNAGDTLTVSGRRLLLWQNGSIYSLSENYHAQISASGTIQIYADANHKASFGGARVDRCIRNGSPVLCP
jgi:hypothetical protein